MERRVLIVDDDPVTLELLAMLLQRRQFSVCTQTCPEAAFRLLAEGDFGAVLVDINLGVASGVDLCREIVALRPEIPVVVMTGFATTAAAIAAIRAGAYDFVTKPLDTDELVLTMERAVRRRDLGHEVKRLRRAAEPPAPLNDMIGESAVMKRLYDVVSRVATTEATVLVTGESGTGKELVARALHARSERAAGPFVAISCAAMPATLLESELFGHEKGAFTDARASRPGLLTRATGGTFFLDEVGEMPLAMQAKLLRALQERTVRPVGSNAEVPFDARIIAATNRDLEAEVHARRFREDLFYRINVVHVRVPPLRERGNDVLLLAQAFLKHCGGGRVVGLTESAAERLLAYPWPGNVRELRNCIERAATLAQFDHLHIDDLPERIGRFQAPGPRPRLAALDPSTIPPIDDVERRHVMQVLKVMGGNKTTAARALGVDRRTLYRKLQRWCADGPDVGREQGEAEAEAKAS